MMMMFIKNMVRKNEWLVRLEKPIRGGTLIFP
jgi:hypothetical protein